MIGEHAVTLTCALAECAAEVALPTTVKVIGPAVTGALSAADKVKVDVAPAAGLVGLNAPVTPAGRS